MGSRKVRTVVDYSMNCWEEMENIFLVIKHFDEKIHSILQYLKIKDAGSRPSLAPGAQPPVPCPACQSGQLTGSWCRLAVSCLSASDICAFLGTSWPSRSFLIRDGHGNPRVAGVIPPLFWLNFHCSYRKYIREQTLIIKRTHASSWMKNLGVLCIS